jgi:phosphoglycerate kinase
LLENLRFHKEETGGGLEFAANLAKLGDIYVNDAFSVCHRSHSSISGVAGFLPHCMGLLLEKEITNLDRVMQNPERPMTALIGGTKVGTKSKLIEKVSDVADCVIISGLIKKEVLEKKLELKNAEKIIGPEDNLGAPDIDEKTIKLFEGKIFNSKTILWNGPFGKFEDEAYAKGTLALANAIIDSKAFSVAGGGETVEFLTKQGILEKFSHVSTGGGAMLQYLAGDVLPGIEALQK